MTSHAYTFTPADRHRLHVISLIHDGTMLSVRKIRGVVASFDLHDTATLDAALAEVLHDMDLKIVQHVQLFAPLMRVAARTSASRE